MGRGNGGRMTLGEINEFKVLSAILEGASLAGTKPDNALFDNRWIVSLDGALALTDAGRARLEDLRRGMRHAIEARVRSAG
jgi:hypothetical protein